MVFWISLKFQTLHIETRSTGTNENFHLTNIFEWVSFYEKIPSHEIIESPLKKENTRKKNNNTHTHKKKNLNKNLNTNNLVSSIFFYHQKILLLFFSVPMKICWKHVKQYNPIGDSSLGEDYFSLSVIWPSLDRKLFVETNSKRKKCENFIEKNTFSFNTGNGKYSCNNIM